MDYTGGDGRDPPEVAAKTSHKHTESCGKGCSETVYDDDTTFDTVGASSDGEDGGDGPITTDGTLIPPSSVAPHPVRSGETFSDGSETLTYGFGPGTADPTSADPLVSSLARWAQCDLVIVHVVRWASESPSWCQTSVCNFTSNFCILNPL